MDTNQPLSICKKERLLPKKASTERDIVEVGEVLFPPETTLCFCLSLFYFNSLYFDVAISAIPRIRTIVWLGWKDPKKVQAAEPKAKTKPT